MLDEELQDVAGPDLRDAAAPPPKTSADDVLPAVRRAPTRLRVEPPPATRRGHLPYGEADGQDDRIEVTSRWIERAGRPWFPVTGEIHYARLPRERWSEVLGHA